MTLISTQSYTPDIPTPAFTPIIPFSREPKLERKDVASYSLGTIGNRQFNAKKGGTARASRIFVALSDMKYSLVKRLSDLKDSFTWAPAEKRAQRAYRAEVRSNSRHIGNLLGSLTSPADCAMGWARITQKLEQLAERSEGNLAKLKGWRYCLETYVADLSNADLKAMRNGVLGNSFAREFLLCEESAKHPGLATEMLNQIAQVLERRLVETLQEPLEGIAEQLSAKPIDGEKLKGCLSSLYSSPAIAALNRYLPHYLLSLPEDQLTEFRALVDQSKQLPYFAALLKAKPDQGRPQAMFKQFCESMRALEQAPVQRDALSLEVGPQFGGLLLQVADEEAQVKDFSDSPLLKPRSQGFLSGLAEKKRVVNAYLDAVTRGDFKRLRADLDYAAEVARSL